MVKKFFISPGKQLQNRVLAQNVRSLWHTRRLSWFWLYRENPRNDWIFLWKSKSQHLGRGGHISTGSYYWPVRLLVGRLEAQKSPVQVRSMFHPKECSSSLGVMEICFQLHLSLQLSPLVLSLCKIKRSASGLPWRSRGQDSALSLWVPGSVPGWGNKIPHAKQCSQKQEKVSLDLQFPNF